jgi:hypothetical protein
LTGDASDNSASGEIVKIGAARFEGTTKRARRGDDLAVFVTCEQPKEVVQFAGDMFKVRHGARYEAVCRCFARDAIHCSSSLASQPTLLALAI